MDILAIRGGPIQELLPFMIRQVQDDFDREVTLTRRGLLCGVFGFVQSALRQMAIERFGVGQDAFSRIEDYLPTPVDRDRRGSARRRVSCSVSG